ncbi:MAG: type IV secretory system conjugative DNA transfer family protein [Candidatus Dormiibacterota bacterium]
MANGSDSATASIAGPAALLGVALIVMVIRLHQGGSHSGSAPALLASSRVAGRSITPELMSRSAQIAASLAAIALLGLSATAKLRGRKILGSGILGRARTARGADLRALRRGTRSRKGSGPRVRLGDHRRRALWLPDDEHLLVLGPTGSGKSSALAIPALLEWPGPVIVTDPKGELVRSTLDHRRTLGKAVVFAPLMEPTARWNPVSSIVSSEDALRVATFLMGRAPDREPFWHDLARQLLHGLLVEAASLELGLSGVLELLQAVPAEAMSEVIRHPVAQRLVQGALSGGDRTSMGVVATLVAQLGAYGSDQVAEATSNSDFNPAEVAQGELKTLYCVVAPHDAPVLRGLISALISSCWRSLFAAPPRVPALFVLDEFTQLTNLPELPALVQLGRSQGVRMILLAQDLGSISASYGHDVAGALWSNCRTKLLLPGISELELLERASRLAGNTTLHRRDSATTEAIASHPLLHPDDIRRLKDRQALLLHGGDQAAVIDQRRWYVDPRLRRRVHLETAERAPSPARGRPLREWTDPDPRWAAATNPLRWNPADVEP